MLHYIEKNGLVFILFLAASTLACSFLADATPTPSPTALPTATPPPATATSTPQLSFTDREVEDLGLSFRYPQSWQIEVDDSSVVVASDAQLLSAEAFDHEGAGVLIVVGDNSSFEGDTLEDALNSAVEEFNFTENDRVVEGPQQVAINGQDAVTETIEGSDAAGNVSLVVQVTLIRAADRTAFVAGVTLQSVVDQYREVLQTVSQSVVLEQLASADGTQPQGQLHYGDTVDGNIDAGGSASWTFIGVEGERINLTVRPLQEELDVTVDIQDAQGESVLPSGAVDDSFGTETVRALTLPSSAQYTVVVSGFGQASGSFELSIDESGALTPAQSITVGDTLNGSLEVDEQDDYSFESPDQEPVTVIVDPSGDLDVVLEVLDAGGEIIYQEDRSYGQEQLSFTPEGTGSYVLRVRGFAGARGDYAISVQAGGVGSTGTTLVTSATLDANDSEGHDFPFTVSQSEVVQAIVTPDGDFDVVVEVWNDDTDEMEESVDASFGQEQVNFTAGGAGNYYFKVLGFEGQGGSYTITLNGAPDVDFELLPGDEVTCDMGQSSNIDYYVRLDPGETLRVSVSPDADTDIVAEILDLDENVLSSIDDGFSGEPEQLDYTAPGGGTEGALYLIRVRSFSGETGGTFSMTLE